MKRIALLGSTGSIGRSTLRVVEDWPDRLEVVGLAAGGNVEALIEQVRRFKPAVVSVTSEEHAARLRQEFPGPGVRIEHGPAGLLAVATDSGADLVVAALVGAAGLRPTLAALEAGIDVALANKETLVSAGEVMTGAARRSGARLLPVDSEHAALHQILDGRRREDLRRLVLTASGGPFRRTPREELERVSVAEALRHPTWSMGAKITIDSATLANKALELIEARWLFDAAPDSLAVLVHPQSVVHALVEWIDGNWLAQLGVADMRSPIQYALGWPERWPARVEPLDLARLGRLDFEPPDLARFPCLALGMSAARAGGTRPAVFNAANEVANLAFREGRCGFLAIPAAIEAALESVPETRGLDLEAVLEADRRGREAASLRLGVASC